MEEKATLEGGFVLPSSFTFIMRLRNLVRLSTKLFIATSYNSLVFWGAITLGFKNGHAPWSTGLTKESDPRVKRCGFQPGNKPWNKNLTAKDDTRVAAYTDKHKGRKRPDLAIQNKDPDMTKKRMGGLKKAIQEGKAGIFKAVKAQHEKPNGLESKILNLLEQISPGEWKYVGDGSVVLGGLNPDIINVNGQKKIIEAFGDHWHTLEDEKKRREIFARYGFETLFVWQHELDGEESLIHKLSAF